MRVSLWLWQGLSKKVVCLVFCIRCRGRVGIRAELAGVSSALVAMVLRMCDVRKFVVVL